MLLGCQEILSHEPVSQGHIYLGSSSEGNEIPSTAGSGFLVFASRPRASAHGADTLSSSAEPDSVNNSPMLFQL